MSKTAACVAGTPCADSHTPVRPTSRVEVLCQRMDEGEGQIQDFQDQVNALTARVAELEGGGSGGGGGGGGGSDDGDDDGGSGGGGGGGSDLSNFFAVDVSANDDEEDGLIITAPRVSIRTPQGKVSTTLRFSNTRHVTRK